MVQRYEQMRRLQWYKCGAAYELGVNFSKDSIESAYCFFHQKLRVYEFSHSHTQRDNIEYAISQYIERMNPLLY